MATSAKTPSRQPDGPAAAAAARFVPTRERIPASLVQAAASTDPFQIAANVLSAGPSTGTPGNYSAIQCTATTSTTIALTGASFVPVRTDLSNGRLLSGVTLADAVQ